MKQQSLAIQAVFERYVANRKISCFLNPVGDSLVILAG